MEKIFQTIFDALPYILGGSLVTVGVVMGAMMIGLLVGVPLALGQVYGGVWVRKIVAAYIWFFRGVPLLVLLFFFYFGVFPIINLELPPFFVAALVLGLISAAYQSQIFRGSILAIPDGQMKAALALGMTQEKAISFVILPQALRLSIPGWSNEYSIVLKDTAVTYALGVPEIMARTHFVATRTYEHLALYLTAGLVYLMLTILGVKLLRKLEERFRIPGYTGYTKKTPFD